MTPEQYQRITDVFSQVIEAPPDKQAELLAALCAGDQTLRREVESLLRVHPAARSFIEKPLQVSLPDELPTVHDVLHTQSFFHLDTEQQARGSSVSDRYVVERELGRGGNGVIYLARDQQLHGRLVVVKVLLDKQQHDPLAQRMFESESEALARIAHPGVVKVLDRGRLLSGQSYFVMEYIRGVTLRDVLKERSLSRAEIVDIVTQIGRALGAAHREGVYHRDLKPENVMLEDLGDGALHVKLIDFGIAKVTNSVVGQEAPDGLVGTLPYMAPEQMLSSGCSAATDIYALGVIAYELLAGERPYKPALSTLRDAIQSLTAMQRAGFGSRLRERCPDLDEEVERVLRKALAYDAEARYASAEAFVNAFLQAMEISARQEAAVRALEEEPTISISNLPPVGGAAEAAAVGETVMVTTGDAPPHVPSAQGKWVERLVVAASVLILVTAVVGVLLWRGRPISHSATVETKMRPQPTLDAMRAVPVRTPALTYDIELVMPGDPRRGKATFNPEDTVPAGKDIVFHMTPHRTGYLYIFAPSNGRLTAFRVPDEPSPAEYPLTFPKDASIGLTRTAVTRFTVILASVKLTVFDGLRPGQALSAAQQRELATLVERLTPQTVVTGDGLRRAVQSPSAADPVVFEIVVRH
ncbi:MAG: serine/threonine protein kinase [Chloracidobacterium sp.]|nr:serine/threonine protein kinase [Chloracidobacterium sp.]MDW8216875.1 serine/threonine-protein kinase [Acidobacteriota bacterium]